MSNNAFLLQGLNQAAQHPCMCLPVRSVASDEDIHIPRGILPSPIATHDFDPKLGFNSYRGGANLLKKFTTLVSRNPRVQIIIELDADLLSAKEPMGKTDGIFDFRTHFLTIRESIIVGTQILDRTSPTLIKLVGEALPYDR